MPMMVCVPCKTLFVIKKNSIDAVYMVGSEVFKVYSSDKWFCPSCGIEVLAGFGADAFIDRSDLINDPEGKFKRYLDESKKRGTLVEFTEGRYW